MSLLPRSPIEHRRLRDNRSSLETDCESGSDFWCLGQFDRMVCLFVSVSDREWLSARECLMGGCWYDCGNLSTSEHKKKKSYFSTRCVTSEIAVRERNQKSSQTRVFKWLACRSLLFFLLLPRLCASAMPSEGYKDELNTMGVTSSVGWAVLRGSGLDVVWLGDSISTPKIFAIHSSPKCCSINMLDSVLR